MRKTKIIATVGPASASDAVIRDLVDGGRRRLPAELLARHARTSRGRSSSRCAARRRRPGRTVAILQDLSGPKIRTGKLRGGGPLPLTGRRRRSRSPSATSRASGQRVSTTYADLPKGVQPRRLAAAGRRPHSAAGEGRDRRRDRDRGRRRRPARRAQGHQRAGRRAADRRV